MNAVYYAPNNLWGKLSYPHHLQNRISYKKIGKTPYELWMDYTPSLK